MIFKVRGRNCFVGIQEVVINDASISIFLDLFKNTASTTFYKHWRTFYAP